MKETLIHADWSMHGHKRWMAAATRSEEGFTAGAAQLWDGGTLLFERNALLGVDFPIGLPLAYANRIGVQDFIQWMPQVPKSFFEVADSAETISLQRPFYPKRPGGTRQQHLFDGLGVSNKRALMRHCDRATTSRKAAESMFWTLGAKQVGKAMLTGWRELLLPNLERLSIWPFEGTLAELAGRSKPIVAESYPGEFYHHLGLSFIGSKRSQAARQQCGETLIAWADAHAIRLKADLVTQLQDGFGPTPDGEDPFDAVVGLLGMLNVVQGGRHEMPDLPPEVRMVEGWILGQTEIGD